MTNFKSHSTYELVVKFIDGLEKSIRIYAENSKMAIKLAEQFNVVVISVKEVF